MNITWPFLTLAPPIIHIFHFIIFLFIKNVTIIYHRINQLDIYLSNSTESSFDGKSVIICISIIFFIVVCQSSLSSKRLHSPFNLANSWQGMHRCFLQNMTYRLLTSENVPRIPSIRYLRYVLLQKHCPIFVSELTILHFQYTVFLHVFRVTSLDNSDDEVF